MCNDDALDTTAAYCALGEQEGVGVALDPVDCIEDGLTVLESVRDGVMLADTVREIVSVGDPVLDGLESADGGLN